MEWDHAYGAPGGYVSEARVDWNDDVEESDEGDNRRRLNINVRQCPSDRAGPRAGGDLAHGGPHHGSGRQNVQLTAMLRNAGNGEARNFSLAWRPAATRSTCASPTGSRCCRTRSARSVGLRLPTAGTYDTQALVDPENRVREGDEGNNGARPAHPRAGSAPTAVPPTPVPFAPDLTIISLTADRTTVQVGESVRLTAVIRNAGNGEARNVSLAWRPGSNAQYLRITDGLTLQPNEERAVEWDYNFPNAGTSDTQALVDPENRVREGNEGNNTLGLRIRVQGPAPTAVPPTPVPTVPDLTVTSLMADNTSPRVGQRVHLTAVISNIGDGVARNFAVGWRMQGNAPYMRVAQGLTLNPGEDATVEWDHVFTNPGTEDSQVWADMDNRVRESNEDNNAMGLRFRKRPAEGPQPGSAPAQPQPPSLSPWKRCRQARRRSWTRGCGWIA